MLAATKEKRVKAKVKPVWFTHDISQAIILIDQLKKNGNHIEYKTHRNNVFKFYLTGQAKLLQERHRRVKREQ